MSEIGRVTQHNDDAQRYAVRLLELLLACAPSLIGAQGIASHYAAEWTREALADDGHMLANFGDANGFSSQSWTIGYNLFADRLLQTYLVDQTVRALSAPASSRPDALTLHR